MYEWPLARLACEVLVCRNAAVFTYRDAIDWELEELRRKARD